MSVANALTRTPGLVRLFLTSIVGRLAMGAISLVAILRVQEMTGSYATGGAVAAALAIAHGVFAPVLGRLADRHGQTRVIVRAAIVHAAALAGFAALPDSAGFEPALVLAAIAGATQPPLTASQRAIWSDTLTDSDDRHRLYSFEAAVFEIVYISGPLLIVGLIGAWSLQAAVVACALFTLGGALAFASSSLSRAWRPHPDRSDDRSGAMSSPGVRTLMMLFLLFGVAMSAIEIAVAAFAADDGSRGAVGLLLGVWGLGSMIGGFAIARLPAPAEAWRRVAVFFVAMGAGTALLPLASDLWSLGALLFVAGIGIAPGLAVAFNLLSDVAPIGTVTEAQTVVSTGIGIGFGFGSALGGWVVESAGTGGSFGLAAAALGLGAGLLATRRDALRVPSPPAPALAGAAA